MSAASPRTQEPSMEEILASIRRIIADDHEVSPGAASQGGRAQAANHPLADDDDDVLDLAEVARPAPTLQRPALVPEPAARAEPVAAVEPAEVEPVHVEPATVIPLQATTVIPDTTPAWEPEPAPEPAPVVAIRPSFSDFEAEPEADEAKPASRGPELTAPETHDSLETLVSDEAMASVGHAFSMLSHTILTQNARTLEDLVKDMLKPMLKAWLDDNLPPLVERLVRTEIERVARGGR
jgi:cell pole-organizing protein PopZ